MDNNQPGPAGPWAVLERLTPKEAEVLRLMAAHLTTREIARMLNITTKTAANYRHNVLKKLRCGRVAT